MRFLFFLLTAALVWWLVRRLLRSPSSDAHRTSHIEETIKTGQQEVMVACTHCHVHLPRSEAIFQGDMAFCGEAHSLAYRQPPANT